MQIQPGDDQIAEMRAEGQLSSEEDTAGPQTCKLTQRKYVDALLDISEEMNLRDQKPYEYYCYSGWEDAVCGWARAAPLSCILMSQKSHKDAEAFIPSSVHQTPSREERSAYVADLRDKIQAGLYDLQKTVILYPHAGEGTHPTDATKVLFLNPPQKNVNYFFAKKKLEEERILQRGSLRPHHWLSKCFVFEKRPPKLRRHNQRPQNTAIPIRNFTFLPAIEPPPVNQNVRCLDCRNLNVSEKHNFYDKMFAFDKNETTEARTDTVTKSELYNAALLPKDKTRQHDPYLFPALIGSLPKKYQVPVSQS